jgi:hypothetical protein
MAGFEIYQEAILKALINNIETAFDDDDKKQFFGNLMDALINDNKPHPIKRNLNPYQKYLSMLYQGWSEIITSYSVLQDIEVYTTIIFTE